MPGGLCLPSDSARFFNTSTTADGNVAGLGYLWNFGDPPSGASNSSTVRNPVHYYNNGGPFNINLKVTSAEGCVHDTTKTLSTVYPQPLSGFTVAAENCFDIPTTFSSSSVGSGQPITNWYWDFGDGSALGSGVNTSHLYAAPGSYTIKHWVKTATNCYSDTTTHTVVVNPLPSVNFSNTFPSCENRTINFNDLSVPNAGALNQWSWNFNDPSSGAANTSNATNPQHSFSTPGTYSVTLIVVTTKGCTDTLPRNIVVNSRPTAGYINPEVCLSDTYAQFLDTSQVDGDVITQWDWLFDDPISGPLNTSTLQNPQHSYNTIGTKNVRLIVTSSNGCRDTTLQSFFVNGDIPVAGLTVQNQNGLCANDSVRIENTSTVNVGSVVKVEIYWDNAGNPGLFQLDDYPYPGKVYSHLYPNFQAPLTRTYQIRFRAYSGATCVDDYFQDITINAAPKVQFNSIPDTCLNVAPFQITQASEIGGVPGSFVFTGPGVSSTGIFDPLSVGPGVYTIKYTYTSAFGCMDSAQKTIRVLAAPIANFGFSRPACETKAITFTDSCSAPVGNITTWTWNFDDGTPPLVRNTNTPFTHVFASASTYNVTLMVTTNNGCNSTVVPKQVIVHPQPLASFTFTDTACLPNAVIQFNNSSSIADGTENSFRYLWNFGEPATGLQNSSTALNPSHLYYNVGPFNVNLRVTSIDGCVDDTMIVVNTIHAQPKARFDFNKPSVCIGDNVKFIDQSDPKDGAYYQWNWDFGDAGNAITQNPVHTYSAIGTYTVSMYMVNSFRCVSDTLPKVFVVYPYPVISAGPDQVVLEGENTILQATATGNDLEYFWADATYLNNNTILRPTCTPVNDITYTLTVTGRGGCPVVDQVKVVVLKTPQIPNTFSPNNDGINDKWVIQYLKTYPNAKVQVFTRTGQKVFESKGYLKPWDGTKEGKPLPIDTYYYIIEPESGRAPVTGYVTIIK
jgi:gliding motility-associated-like protein